MTSCKHIAKKWLLITRAHFLLATFVPLIFASTWSLHLVNPGTMRLDLLFALSLGTIACHLAANTFNDYFDWQSGGDQINTNYIMSISGGSRAVELGLITEPTLFIVASSFLAIAAICGFYITIIKGPIILLFSLIGAFGIYFYVAPPIRLAARHGLGELFIFICFGPAFIMGVIYVLTGIIDFTGFFVSIPIGLLITSVLAINEYPDLAADRMVGKNNLAVVLGEKWLPFGITALTLLAYIITIVGIAMHIFPKAFLLAMLTIPLAIYEIKLVFNLNKSREHMCKACVNNLKLYAIFGLSFILASVI